MSAGDWKDLYDAAMVGDLSRVRYHIDAGVDPNYQHPEIMCTPLVAAIMGGHTDIAEYLLDHGADPNLRSSMDNLTPLEAAEQQGHGELVSRLAGVVPQRRKSSLWRRLFFRT
ncbi:ankyrin repeat domain-containing protein [Aliidiomarina indica]|uniref:ankyrin repeat domain-containing protein n=1 Tax=Aliidiomarina indica TaxID=2749147 RepID=UPI00188E07A6|nr:ankyrin repeat domain-containing protein [Aliidiomarina indica]